MPSEEQIIQAVANEVFRRMVGEGMCVPMNTVAGCDGEGIDAPCRNMLHSPVTTEKFYRSGRLILDQVESGVFPLAPGQTAVLTHRSAPGWASGCFMFTYRLANNGTNHNDIRIRFFVDDYELDHDMFGSEIYDNGNTLIGDGYHPIPLTGGRQCCIGALNKLRIQISHEGANNQLEQPRIIVRHGKTACCNACAVGMSCQQGCNGKKDNCKLPERPSVPQPAPPVPMLAAPNMVVLQQK